MTKVEGLPVIDLVESEEITVGEAMTEAERVRRERRKMLALERKLRWRANNPEKYREGLKRDAPLAREQMPRMRQRRRAN